jgi:hypothetical protein
MVIKRFTSSVGRDRSIPFALSIPADRRISSSEGSPWMKNPPEEVSLSIFSLDGSTMTKSFLVRISSWIIVCAVSSEPQTI